MGNNAYKSIRIAKDPIMQAFAEKNTTNFSQSMTLLVELYVQSVGGIENIKDLAAEHRKAVRNTFMGSVLPNGFVTAEGTEPTQHHASDEPESREVRNTVKTDASASRTAAPGMTTASAMQEDESIPSCYL